MGAAMDLDRIAPLLNINAASCEINIAGTGPVKLSSADVYGALGMGNLSAQAGIIGLAYYCRDAKMIRAARDIGSEISVKTFDKEGWSATTPFKKRVNDLVRSKELPAELAGAEKVGRGERLKVKMGFTAVDELMQGGICNKCNGSGWVQDSAVRHDKHMSCPRCGGVGRDKFSGSRVAEVLMISEDSYKRTWHPRYQFVKSKVISRLNEFEIHVSLRVGR